jgi:hypothetical protein
MPKKIILVFIKYFLEKKNLIKSSYHKRKKKKPIPRKFTFLNPAQKKSFEKGLNYPVLPSSPNKKPFEKIK